MKITLNNVDLLLETELKKINSVVGIEDDPDGVFIKWVDSSSPQFNSQTKCVKHCLENNKPLIIFDEFQKMTLEEMTFLLKPGVLLWEPYLDDRMLFSYQPCWGTFYEDIEWNFNETRMVDFGCVLPLKGIIPTFEKYYSPIAETGEFNVSYFNENVSDNIRERLSKNRITVFGSNNTPTMKCSMLLGTPSQYESGYFSSHIFDLLEKGIVPLLPEEHRWYHSVFSELVIRRPFDIEFLLKNYDNIGYGLIRHIYDGLSDFLPEANVVNVADRIKTFIE